MNKFALGLMFGSMVLAGCTLIPDYSPAPMPVAAEWPVQGVPAANDDGETITPMAAIAWQEYFKSPRLREVIATALEHNRDMRLAALNVQVVRNAYRIQRASMLPAITGEASGVKQKISQNVPFQQDDGSASTSYISEYYTAEVAVSYGLDFFGRIRSLNKAAMQEFLASKEARRAVQVSLISEVANAYLQLLADREILALTEQTLNAQERSFDLISRRFEKGIADKLELSQAQIPLETARVNHALYTRLMQQDINALSLLMGQENTALLSDDTGVLSEVKLKGGLPIGLPSEVLLLRPDIRQAEHELLRANANIGAARAAFFPTIRLTGSIGESSQDLSNLFTSTAGQVWSFAPSITVPIFEGGRNFANLRVSETEREIAATRYERTIQAAFREVADELAAHATLGEQMAAQERLVQAATAAYATSQARYDEGIDSFLTVLDAQRSKYVAEQQLIETKKQLLANKVNLYKVLGGGQISEDRP